MKWGDFYPKGHRSNHYHYHNHYSTSQLKNRRLWPYFTSGWIRIHLYTNAGCLLWVCVDCIDILCFCQHILTTARRGNEFKLDWDMEACNHEVWRAVIVVIRCMNARISPRHSCIYIQLLCISSPSPPHHHHLPQNRLSEWTLQVGICIDTYSVMHSCGHSYLQQTRHSVFLCIINVFFFTSENLLCFIQRKRWY